jgi:N-acetylneuraminic acid mutarotase
MKSVLAVPVCLGLLLAACETATAPEPRAPDAGLGVAGALPDLVNSWATKSPVVTARNFAVAGAQNNIIYFVGGRDAGGQSTKTVMAYTIATNSWAFKASLPVNRRAANGASLLDGRLYVSGGISNTGGAANPATNTWLKKANMPTASACGAQGVIDGRLYVYAPAGGACVGAGGISTKDEAYTP